MRIVVGLVAATLGAACGEPGLPARAHERYVVSELRIPTTNTMARADGLDLDRDVVVDNNLGQVFAALAGEGLGVGATAQEALLRGGLIMLADLETSDFVSADAASFTTYLGADPSPAPCLDPTRLETCGQHLLGTASFAVVPGSGSGQAVGPIDRGIFVGDVGVLPIELAIDPAQPIRLDLHGARARLTAISRDHISGVLAGGVTQVDIDGVVVPQAAMQIARIVSNECMQPAGNGPCGCLGNSRAEALQSVFDANDDCTVDPAEVAGNQITQSLLAPDVRVDGQELLSFGVGVELARAEFVASP